jgi:YcaO-like protein with predicted kinase domain
MIGLPARTRAAVGRLRGDGAPRPGADDVLERAARAARSRGVTRLADVTRLDNLGVFVFQAVRPLGATLAVHQGKALDPRGAMIGALMEALECDRAEDFEGEPMTAAFRDLAPDERAASLADFAYARDRPPGDDEPLRWVAARRILDGRRLWVPLDVVSLDLGRPAHPRLGRSSNGLAARHDHEGAILKGLQEVIERDTESAWLALPIERRTRDILELGTIPFAWFRELRERIRRAGLFLSIYKPAAVVPAPVFLTEIFEPGAGRCLRRRALGLACRARAEDALLASVSEAAQARLTAISGARDDILHAESGPAAGDGFGLGLPPPTHIAPRRWEEVEAAAPDTRLATSAGLAAALDEAGYPDVAAVDLSGDDDGLIVVKVVAPGLGAFGRTRRRIGADDRGTWAGPPRAAPTGRGRVSRAPAVIVGGGALDIQAGKGRIAVLAGPSLPAAVRPADRRLVWFPPAVAGDAYRLIEARPRALVLIDGLFDDWPAIRHKELLELMAAGTRVIGGASMGALRAAELRDWGMIGVGGIFTAYVDGRLTGDDEVAVLHGPEALDWAALTEALVNVRATLFRAVRERILPGGVARVALRAAQSTFYKERTWDLLCRTLALDHGHALEAQALRRWLPRGRVNVKQTDALACLRAALALDGVPATTRPPPPPRSPFAEALAAQVSRRVKSPEKPGAPRPETGSPPPGT